MLLANGRIGVAHLANAGKGEWIDRRLAKCRLQREVLMSELDKLSAKVTSYELSRPFRAGQGANQQESKRLFESMLTKAGSDLNRFEELKKLNAAELADWIARVTAESAEQSS